MAIRPHGIWTALVTPFDSRGTLDWESFDSLLVQQKTAGVAGVVIAGSTGEGPALTAQEKVALFRRSQAKLGGLPWMATTGSSSTQQSVELSRLAAQAGAHALLVVTPPYVRANLQGLVQHFRLIKEAVGDCPVCLYHVPSRTGQHLSSDELAQICVEAGLDGIKEASGQLHTLSLLGGKAPKLSLFSGDDASLLASLAVGGAGLISVASGLFPRAHVQLWKSFADGDHQQALRIHRILLAFWEQLGCEVNPVAIKAAIAHVQLIRCPQPRLPLAPLAAHLYTGLIQAMEHTQARLGDLHLEEPWARSNAFDLASREAQL